MVHISVKHQKKIMVWECFSWYGVGAFGQINSILTKEKYRQILIHHMQPSARRLRGENYIFQHDNGPKHTATIVKNYLRNQKIEVLLWPAQSPDLNPIENLWFELDRRVDKCACNREEELFECLKRAWANIDHGYLAKLLESIPKRCKRIIKSCGYPISY